MRHSATYTYDMITVMRAHSVLWLTFTPFLAHNVERGVPTTAFTVFPVLVNSTTTSAFTHARSTSKDGWCHTKGQKYVVRIED